MLNCCTRGRRGDLNYQSNNIGLLAVELNDELTGPSTHNSKHPAGSTLNVTCTSHACCRTPLISNTWCSQRKKWCRKWSRRHSLAQLAGPGRRTFWSILYSNCTCDSYFIALCVHFLGTMINSHKLVHSAPYFNKLFGITCHQPRKFEYYQPQPLGVRLRITIFMSPSFGSKLNEETKENMMCTVISIAKIEVEMIASLKFLRRQ